MLMERLGGTFSAVTLLLVTLLSVECQDGENFNCNVVKCKAPVCYCPTSRIPMDISPEKVPQMILFAFGGPLDFTRRTFVKDLFSPKRRNPNGSPIRATFFVSDDNGKTDYCTVNNMWADGHEIASFSVSRREPSHWWATANENAWAMEIDKQKEYILTNTSIPEDDITGFRSPHLQPGGNVQYNFALKSNWTYDSTLVLPDKYNLESQSKLWPYTMDTQAKFICHTYECPSGSFPGLWQVPFQPLTDTYGESCNYLDSCNNAPKDDDDVFRILMQSFNRSYNNNRVPMMVNFLNYKEFFETNTPWAIDGIHMFLNEVLAYEAEDVWIVTYQDMVEWMNHPLDLTLIKFFESFSRNIDDRQSRKVRCIQKRPPTALFDGPTVVILEILVCGTAFIFLYFRDKYEDS